jgi:transcriptional regulator with XRE-family HTH domain
MLARKYPIGYDRVMPGWERLLVSARRRAGLSQADLAARAGTSRPTLSAYEHGRKAPTVETLERVMWAAGARLDVAPVVSWREVPVGRGRSCWLPDTLWRLTPARAFADVVLPVELNWSAPGHRYALRDRRQRARLYELVMREGEPADLERWVDGALLIDLWPDLVLPRGLREGWQALINATLAADASTWHVAGRDAAGTSLGAAS